MFEQPAIPKLNIMIALNSVAFIVPSFKNLNG